MGLRWAWPLALAFLLALPPMSVSGVGPVATGGPYVALDASAFSALIEVFEDDDGFYPRNPGSDVYLVRDQMMASLAFLAAADRVDPPDAAHEASALTLWRSVGGWDASNAFYAVDMKAPSNCYDLETNAWAMMAAWSLAGRNGLQATDAGQRARALLGSLAGALEDNEFREIPVCDPGVDAKAVALMALTIRLEDQSDGVADQTVRTVLDELMAARFDQAFYNDEGIYGVVVNAQMLLVLVWAAERHGEPVYGSARDSLTDFLRDAFDGAGGTLAARSVRRDAQLTPVPSLSPEAQMWTALAFDATTETGPVPALLSTIYARFWQAASGALSQDDGRLDASTQALAAMTTRTPPVEQSRRTQSNVFLVVDNRATFAYPDHWTEQADEFLISNRHERTFTIDWGQSPTTSGLLYPADEIGELFLRNAESRFHPAPQLRRDGQPVQATVVGQGAGFLQISDPGAIGEEVYSLVASNPVIPQGYSFENDTVLIGIENQLDRAIVLPQLIVELKLTRANVTRVSIQEVPVTAFQAVALDGNVYMEVPHTRLLLEPATLQPGLNIIDVTYRDVEAPRLGPVRIYRDAFALEPITPEGQKYALLTNERVYVGVSASDNARVQRMEVVVSLARQEQDRTIVMTAVPDRDGWYVGELRPASSGTGSLKVRATDPSGNVRLAADEPALDVRSSLLSSGSIVLVVFSGVLFFATAFIWLKMHRRQGGS